MEKDRLCRPITVERIRVINKDFKRRYEELRENEEKFRAALLNWGKRNDELAECIRELRDVTNEFACLGK